MNTLRQFEFINIFKKIKNKDLFLITSVIYFAIIFLYELFYCNFEFITGIIENYNFSLYRIIVYGFIYLIFYKIKDKFLDDAVDALNNKVKCYFVFIIFFFSIVFSISLTYLIAKNFSINIIVAIISIFVFNLFSLYVSNNMIKNVIITTLLFGSIFSISITFNNQLDEKIHFLSSYSISVGEFNLNHPKIESNVANMPRMMEITEFIKYFSEKPCGEIVEDFSDRKVEDSLCGYITISHFAGGIGIFISKILGRKHCRYIYNRKNF